MAINPKQLLPATYLAGAVAELFTVDSAPTKYWIITEIRLNNIDTVEHTFTMHAYPTGGAVSNENKLYDTITIQPSGAEPVVYSCFIVLNPGDVVEAFADTADKVSIFMSGQKWT